MLFALKCYSDGNHAQSGRCQRDCKGVTFLSVVLIYSLRRGQSKLCLFVFLFVFCCCFLFFSNEFSLGKLSLYA